MAKKRSRAKKKNTHFIAKLMLKLCLVALIPAAVVLIYLDAKITATFADKMWELPAKVYAGRSNYMLAPMWTRQNWLLN